MSLEKATIKRHLPPRGETIEVLFNPTQYKISKSNQFAEVGVPGLAAPLLQFGRGNAGVLSMQLFFDTYEQRVDVRTYTGKVMELLDLDHDLHAPPVCLFTWGKLNFKGVLERAEQTFTLFLPEGIPVRATMDVSFKEFFEGEPGFLQSANYTKHHVVQRGDTLTSIAGHFYDDPRLWRKIAEWNQIDNPLAIRPGQRLTIPVVE